MSKAKSSKAAGVAFRGAPTTPREPRSENERPSTLEFDRILILNEAGGVEAFDSPQRLFGDGDVFI